MTEVEASIVATPDRTFEPKLSVSLFLFHVHPVVGYTHRNQEDLAQQHQRDLERYPSALAPGEDKKQDVQCQHD